MDHAGCRYFDFIMLDVTWSHSTAGDAILGRIHVENSQKIMAVSPKETDFDMKTILGVGKFTHPLQSPYDGYETGLAGIDNKVNFIVSHLKQRCWNANFGMEIPNGHLKVFTTVRSLVKLFERSSVRIV